MKTPNYYAVIPANVRYDNKLKANEKLLYGEITALSNKQGFCNASNLYFADLYNKHKDTISNWISNLTRKGYIKTQLIKDEEGKIKERKIFLSAKLPIPYKKINIRGIAKAEFVRDTEDKKKKKKRFQSAKMPRGYRQKCLGGIGENTVGNITRLIEEEKEIEKFFKKNFGDKNLCDTQQKEIKDFLKKGITKDLIIEIMKYAINRNAKSFSYIETTIKDCLKNKVYTTEQFNAKQQEYKINKRKSSTKAIQNKGNFNQRNYGNTEIENLYANKLGGSL